MLVELVADAQREAVAAFLVARDVEVVVVHVEQVEAGDDVAVEEIRIGDREIDLASALREDAVEAGIDAGADQVALAQAGAQQRAGIGRVAAADVSSPVAFSSILVVSTALSGAEPGAGVMLTVLK